MPEPQTFVLVGASLAGGRAAEVLRERGFEGRILLIGAEPERPYERPPLSKEFLQGRVAVDGIYLHPYEFYAEHRIELRLGVRAVGLSPAEKLLFLDDGTSVRYDKLLIATGCDVIRPNLPGFHLPGVHYLRTLQDAATLAAALPGAGRVAVIGAGFIGLEVAASARTLGREVTVIEMLEVPLERVLGRALGEFCAAVHRDNGVDLRLRSRVATLRGSRCVEEVVLENGEAIPCDLVVVGVGVRPAATWLAGSGIALDDGVLVNEYTETSVPDVYAAGDVARWWNPLFGERMRVEHFDHAHLHGAAAAAAMLGGAEPYVSVPYFWSDQYDLTLQYVGHASPGDEITVRGDLASRNFTGFYLRDGRIRAAFSVGRPRDVTTARRLIRSGKAAAPSQLADEAFDLRQLL